MIPHRNPNMSPLENRINRALGRLFGILLVLAACAGLLYLLIWLARETVELVRAPL